VSRRRPDLGKDHTPGQVRRASVAAASEEAAEPADPERQDGGGREGVGEVGEAARRTAGRDHEHERDGA